MTVMSIRGEESVWGGGDRERESMRDDVMSGSIAQGIIHDNGA